MLDTRKMLSDVNGEITRLGKIRDLLMMENGAGTEAGIRPLEIRNTTMRVVDMPPPAKKKRRLSAAGRAAIGAAVRKRWAEARKKGIGTNGVPLKAAAKKKTAAKKRAAKKAAKSQPQSIP